MRTKQETTHRVGLPRGLLPRRRPARWAYKIGDVLDYADHFAIVMDRQRTAAGHQIYELHLLGDRTGRPDRHVRAEYIPNPLPSSAHAS